MDYSTVFKKHAIYSEYSSISRSSIIAISRLNLALSQKYGNPIRVFNTISHGFIPSDKIDEYA